MDASLTIFLFCLSSNEEGLKMLYYSLSMNISLFAFPPDAYIFLFFFKCRLLCCVSFWNRTLLMRLFLIWMPDVGQYKDNFLVFWCMSVITPLAVFCSSENFSLFISFDNPVFYITRKSFLCNVAKQRHEKYWNKI